MGIFKRKKKDITIIPVIVKTSDIKKISIFDVNRQAYYEITMTEYYLKLKALGLSDDEATKKIKAVSE